MEGFSIESWIVDSNSRTLYTRVQDVDASLYTLIRIHALLICLGDGADDVSDALRKLLTIGDKGQVADETMCFIRDICNPCSCARPLEIQLRCNVTERIFRFFYIKVFKRVEEEWNTQLIIQSLIICWFVMLCLFLPGYCKLSIIFRTHIVIEQEVAIQAMKKVRMPIMILPPPSRNAFKI